MRSSSTTRWLAREPKMRVGETVVLRIGRETTWRVVGLAQEAFSPRSLTSRLSFIQQQQPGMVNSLRLALAQDRSRIPSVSSKRTWIEISSSKACARVQLEQGRKPVRFRSAHGDDLRVSDRDVGDRWQRRRLGLMTTMSLNVLRATARDGRDASAWRDAASRLVDDRGGREL